MGARVRWVAWPGEPRSEAWLRLWRSRGLGGAPENTQVLPCTGFPAKDSQGWAARQGGSKSPLENAYNYPYSCTQACMYAFIYVYVYLYMLI